jgi:hypothetical protein
MQHRVLNPAVVQLPITFNQFLSTIPATVEWDDIDAQFGLAH